MYACAHVHSCMEFIIIHGCTLKTMESAPILPSTRKCLASPAAWGFRFSVFLPHFHDCNLRNTHITPNAGCDSMPKSEREEKFVPSPIFPSMRMLYIFQKRLTLPLDELEIPTKYISWPYFIHTSVLTFAEEYIILTSTLCSLSSRLCVFKEGDGVSQWCLPTFPNSTQIYNLLN